ncbi:MAG: FAD-dependent oxidoreductase [Desulfobacterales bacterium]|jgi:NADPH-dependent glutamate synthase beta subunit-like oxidoreductase/glutamate synthase domain-containing protein 3/NAD-dependent dihydropyrimidine dehydrogenase PreA subunit|nr:FAD-dependent oxidoreductase [Desulfobacterales bacterium]
MTESRQHHGSSPVAISGRQAGERVSSRILEEQIQAAVAAGHRRLQVDAYGQHGIGGRLWRAGAETVSIRVTGHPGQRVGSMGFPGTRIEVFGPASDDVGWLNAGAEITIHGHAGNGTANAMAQGRIFVGGNIGARGMTMTKHNPRFSAPELWVLGSVGDYFGEFMAGGIAVVCGHEAQAPDNVLGYRPLVGMVGGKVFFRGPHAGFSRADARMAPIGDPDWEWLAANLGGFLKKISRPELLKPFSERSHWQLLVARQPNEKTGRAVRSIAAFHRERWEAELGRGGLIGDLTHIDRSVIPVITTGALRRFIPVWENQKYAAPCEASCPTGIPVQRRWQLIREGRVEEAVDLALAYTPFPAAVCGYLCPNLCMQSCTRGMAAMAPVDTTRIGQASIGARLPELPPVIGKRIAVIGGGPAGLSVAWQLRLRGHEAVVYEVAGRLGGKFTRVIPESRIPREVIDTELGRVKEVLSHVHLQQPLGADDIAHMREDFDYLVLATGAQRPRMLPVPGIDRAVAALDFLDAATAGSAVCGKRVVIIGAGNVGCDVATEAHRLGAEEITLLDVQQPASFGKERRAAEAVGARFRWPVTTQAITADGVRLADGELIPADTVIVSIGEAPELSFLPPGIAAERGFVKVDAEQRTSDPKIFAIGDLVRPGLLTEAIGAGRRVAQTICDESDGRTPAPFRRQMIAQRRVTLEYFDPRIVAFGDLAQCGSQCLSCGACRDCGVCVAVCPQGAISRRDLAGEYEYAVDENLCIGCGFCAGACPCGVWNLEENFPLE